MTYLPPEALPFTISFNDNVNEVLDVGDLPTDGFIQVEFTASAPTGQSSYVVTYGVSPTGIAGAADPPDILQIDSDNPLSTVEVGTNVSGSDVQVTFTGTGPGDLVTVRGRIKRIPRN